jgi:hypothetical protein
MIRNYKIIKNVYADEFGSEQEVFFTIEYRTKFFFWHIWKTVKHRMSDLILVEDDYAVTKFHSIEQAEKFVHDYIVGDRPWQEWISEREK